MARKPRIHFPGAVYHVILRGNDRQDIFFRDEDRTRFFLLLQEGVERFGYRVLAFCLMTNHVHLALQVGEVPLSRILQNLTFRYTRWINWRQKRNGHLFQGRYRAILVDADSYLLELTAYLHLNPLRVGMAEAPENYPWSSHRAYLGEETIPWLDTSLVLGQFSPQPTAARRRLAEYVAERSGEGHRDDFYGLGSCDGRVMGEEPFVSSVLDQSEELLPAKPTTDEILAIVVKLQGVSPEELAAPGQNRRVGEARNLTAWAVRTMTNESLTALAARLGRDPSTLSSAVRRFSDRSKSDNKVAELIGKLRKELQVAILQA